MFKRHISDDIKEMLQYFPALGLVGARQVGKTTLAKSIIEDLNKPALYLDMELSEDFAKMTEPELFLNQYKDYCVVLDEVQRVPNLYPILRALIDQQATWKVFSSGLCFA